MSERISESPRPLSQSGIWGVLTRFYGEQGLDVWRSGTVPRRVTSQGYLADVYAGVISAFARDLVYQGIAAPPLILEVGGGSGLSAWILLNRLLRHHSVGPEPPRFDYLLTETDLDHVRGWGRLDRLRRMVDEGPLHLGVLEVAGPAPSQVITLDGVRLDLADRPIVLVANYVFDSLPCDLYRVRDGRLFEELVSLEGTVRSDDGVPSLSGVTIDFEASEVDAPNTGHPVVDGVLGRYRELPGDPCIPVCMALVSFLEPLLASAHPFLMLAGDIAYTTPRFGTEPPLIHDHYIACTANFHLLGELFEQCGGAKVFAQHPDPVFSAAAFFRSTEGLDLPRTREAAWTALRYFGPHDALNLENALAEHGGPLDFPMVSAWARLARYDADVTRFCIPHLLRIIEADEAFDRTVLRDMLFEAFRLELPEVTGEDSLATEIAFLLFRAGMHSDVMDFLQLLDSDADRTGECLHLEAVSAERLGEHDRAASLLSEVGAAERDYWNGWPSDRPSPTLDTRALLTAEDAVHCDHVVLRMAVAEFHRMGADGADDSDG